MIIQKVIRHSRERIEDELIHMGKCILIIQRKKCGLTLKIFLMVTMSRATREHFGLDDEITLVVRIMHTLVMGMNVMGSLTINLSTELYLTGKRSVQKHQYSLHNTMTVILVYVNV